MVCASVVHMPTVSMSLSVCVLCGCVLCVSVKSVFFYSVQCVCSM